MAVYPRTGGTEVPAQPHFPSLERDVLDHWEASDTFGESVRQRPADSWRLCKGRNCAGVACRSWACAARASAK